MSSDKHYCPGVSAIIVSIPIHSGVASQPFSLKLQLFISPRKFIESLRSLKQHKHLWINESLYCSKQLHKLEKNSTVQSITSPTAHNLIEQWFIQHCNEP